MSYNENDVPTAEYLDGLAVERAIAASEGQTEHVAEIDAEVARVQGQTAAVPADPGA